MTDRHTNSRGDWYGTLICKFRGQKESYTSGSYIRIQPTSSRRLLPTRCRLVVVDATSVATRDATACSMGPTPCLHRHHRPWNASSAANANATHPAIEQVSSRQCRTWRTSQQVQLRDQPGMQPIRSQTGSGARTRASGPRRPMYLHALSQIRRSLSPLRRRLAWQWRKVGPSLIFLILLNVRSLISD